MRGYIILNPLLNFFFIYTRPLVNEPHNITEISWGKKVYTYCLIIAVLIVVGVKKVHKRAGETYHLNTKGPS